MNLLVKLSERFDLTNADTPFKPDSEIPLSEGYNTRKPFYDVKLGLKIPNE